MAAQRGGEGRMARDPAGRLASLGSSWPGGSRSPSSSRDRIPARAPEALLCHATPAANRLCSRWWMSSPAGSACRRPPEVMTVDGDGSPFPSAGLHRPTLVLPRGLAGSLDPEALRSVLLHELAHLGSRPAVGLDSGERPPPISSSRRPTTSSIAPPGAANWPATRPRWS